MAECILLHFRDAGWDDVRVIMDRLGEWSEARQRWACPSWSSWVLLAGKYTELLEEYEDEDLAALTAVLGGLPSSSLAVELRRSAQEAACDLAGELTAELLERFPGVVDDTASGVWTLSELRAGERKEHGCFLDYYRPGRFTE